MEVCVCMIIEEELKKARQHDIYDKTHGVAHRLSKEPKLSTSADIDAAKMSRFGGGELFIGENDKVNNYRLCMLNGQSFYKKGMDIREDTIDSIHKEIFDETLSSDSIFDNLLKSQYVSKFNESVDKPFTSLKYHTLLVSGLHYNYVNNRKFSDLHFKIMDIKDIEDKNTIIFMDTLNNKCFSISDIHTNKKYESVSLLGVPMMNFGDVMSRLRGEVYIDKYIYSNLRRIKSWSVGLQYYDDILHNHDDAFNRVSL